MVHVFENVLPPESRIRKLIEGYLADDVPSFDVGGFVVGNTVQTAHLLGKSPGIISGAAFAKRVFQMCELEQEWIKYDGEEITEKEALEKLPICVVKGKIKNILLAERTALNIMTRASGVATSARNVATMIQAKRPNWKGQIAGTRKTTPGFGLIEKYSLLVGGVSTHRLDLTQMTMLKDNHVWSTGSIKAAVEKAKAATGFSSKIEVECRNFDEAVEAAETGADIIMLDNYTPDMIRRDGPKLKKLFPFVLIEASGGITEATIADYCLDSIDIISMGKLTQGYQTLDFSLKVQRKSSL